MFVVSDHSMDTTLERRPRCGSRSTPAASRTRTSSSSRTAASTWSTSRTASGPDRDEVLKQMREIAVGSARRRRGALPRAQPRRRRPRAHARRRPPGLADRGRPDRRPLRHPRRGRRVQRAEPADRQPRRPADQRQHVRRLLRRPRRSASSRSRGRRPALRRHAAEPGQAQNVDVAPTVMALFGLAPPRDAEGRVLDRGVRARRAPGAGSLIARDGDHRHAPRHPDDCRVTSAFAPRASARGGAAAARRALADRAPATVDVFQQSRRPRASSTAGSSRASATAGRLHVERPRQPPPRPRRRSSSCACARGRDTRRFASAASTAASASAALRAAAAVRASSSSARRCRARSSSRAPRADDHLPHRARAAVARPDPPARARRQLVAASAPARPASPTACGSAARACGRGDFEVRLVARGGGEQRTRGSSAAGSRGSEQSPPKPRAIAAASWRSAPR